MIDKLRSMEQDKLCMQDMVSCMIIVTLVVIYSLI